MKKILLGINHYFSHAWVAIIILSVSLLGVLYLNTIYLLSLTSETAFFDNLSVFFFYFFSSISPFLLLSLILALFLWIRYRRADEKEISDAGFKNVIITLFAIFFLFLLPIRLATVARNVQHYNDEQAKWMQEQFKINQPK